MTFNEFLFQIGKIEDLRNSATMIREDYDDYGAHPNCGCGCGGDTFDWELQEQMYEHADKLDMEAMDLIKDLWIKTTKEEENRKMRNTFLSGLRERQEVKK